MSLLQHEHPLGNWLQLALYQARTLPVSLHTSVYRSKGRRQRLENWPLSDNCFCPCTLEGCQLHYVPNDMNPWCVMMCYDVLWCVMMCYDVLWCVMMSYDMLWCDNTLTFSYSPQDPIGLPNDAKAQPCTAKKTGHWIASICISLASAHISVEFFTWVNFSSSLLVASNKKTSNRSKIAMSFISAPGARCLWRVRCGRDTDRSMWRQVCEWGQ